MNHLLLKKWSLVGLFLLTICSCLTTQAQDRAITGTVIDSVSNQRVPGASIVVKGTQRGTTSDSNGAFLLSVPGSNDVTLVISFVGYLSKEISINNQSSVTVQLNVDSKVLNEVVVVSYGTQRKREVTGSVATLDARQLEDQPVGQFGQRLQGRVAGVQVNQGTGRPGQGVSFRIRGAASVNAGNEPLYVIDGLPLIGNINQINPDEIDNFSIQKDASATALYGSRAANGVVLITTKKAKEGKTQITFNSNYGVQVVPQKGRPDLMNARDFAQYVKESYEDRAYYEGYKDGVPAAYQNPDQYGQGTDWYGILLKQAPISNNTLTLATNNGRFSSATTLGVFSQGGVMLNTDFKRYSLRSNNEYRINKNLRVGVNVAPSFQTSQFFNTDGSQAAGIIFQARTVLPTISPYNSDGSLKIALVDPITLTQPNWLRVLQERTNRLNSLRVLANGYAEIDFLRHLRFKTSINLELQSSTMNTFTPSTAGGSIFEAPPVKASGQYDTDQYQSWLNENVLTYSNDFGKHNLEALAGYTIQEYTAQSGQLRGANFPDDAVRYISAAATQTGTSNTSSWSLLSLVGRLNYNYKGKYLVSLAVRRDGSSRFGVQNRYGTFPSVSAGYILSDEPFFQNLAGRVDFLKLRASYGATGNFNIGNYNQYANIGTVNYVFNNAIAPGRAQTSLGNNELTWEKTNQFDIGLDVGLLNNRIYLTYDYYAKRTKGLLYQVDVPRASGFSNIQSNIGEFAFWGHEFAISSKNIVSKAFSWNTDFNISFNRNKVLQLGTNNTPIGGYPDRGLLDYWRTAVGEPIGQFYGYVYEGVYLNQSDLDKSPKPTELIGGSNHAVIGGAKFKDLNGDGVITNAGDRTSIGNPNPKFNFGITNSFTYRNFDLTVVASGAVGGKIMDGQLEWAEFNFGLINVNNSLKDRFRTPDKPGNGPIDRRISRYGLELPYSTRWVYDADYLTIKNITLGYRLPVQSLKYFDRLRVYASLQQAFVFTNYKGSNPEVSFFGLNGLNQGVDLGAYPVPRSYALGLNITFK